MAKYFRFIGIFLIVCASLIIIGSMYSFGWYLVKNIKQEAGYEWWQVRLSLAILAVDSVFGPALGLLFCSHAKLMSAKPQTQIVYTKEEDNISEVQVTKPGEARQSTTNSWEIAFKKKEIIDKYYEGGRQPSFQEVQDLMKLSLDELEKKLGE